MVLQEESVVAENEGAHLPVIAVRGGRSVLTKESCLPCQQSTNNIRFAGQQSRRSTNSISTADNDNGRTDLSDGVMTW